MTMKKDDVKIGKQTVEGYYLSTRGFQKYQEQSPPVRKQVVCDLLTDVLLFAAAEGFDIDKLTSFSLANASKGEDK